MNHRVVLFLSPGLLAAAALAQDAPTAFHEAVKADNPILWYQFNELAGATVFNHGSLGSKYDGTYYNGVGLGAPSQQGDPSACFSQGAKQYVKTDAMVPASLTGNPDFSCEALVFVFNVGSGGSYPTFLFWGIPGTGNSMYFSLHNTSKNKFYGGFYNGGLRTVDTFAPGQWYHVVMTRDSGGGMNNPLTGTKLYVNGEEAATETDTVLCCNTTVPHITSGPFYVQNNGDLTRYFSGDMDEVVLYDYVMTAQQVKDHYDTLAFQAPCYPDCDKSGGLDLFDFLCFTNNFNQGKAEADCDRNACGVNLDLFDFLCFTNAFNAGCP